MTEQKKLRKEHESVRNKVGFYDFTHQLLEVSGKNAGSFLDKMFVNSVEATKPGHAVYTTMLNEDGIIIDDVIIFRLEENKFWVSTLFIEDMKKWFKNYSDIEELHFKDITDDISMHAVQGPDSRKVLNEILEEDINDMKFFEIKDNKIGNLDVKICRAGFTGELGYEVYCDSKDVEKLQKELLEKGKKYDIVHLETDVILMSLPGEKGYVIMDDLEGTNPLETGFGWSVDWETDFVGKKTLEKVEKEGPKRRLRGYTVENDNASIENDDPVKVKGKEVGRVTKAFYGFTLEKNLGYILLYSEYAEIGNKVTIVSNDKEIEATLTKKTFYDPKDERVRG